MRHALILSVLLWTYDGSTWVAIQEYNTISICSVVKDKLLTLNIYKNSMCLPISISPLGKRIQPKKKWYWYKGTEHNVLPENFPRF